MPKPPSNKTRTQPGLGSSNGLPRMDSSEMKRVRDSFRQEESPPPPGVHRGGETLESPFDERPRKKTLGE